MENIFTVYRDGTAFGRASMAREALYYRISVRCPEPVRVSIYGDKGFRDLGICVPSGNEFIIETRIPSKQIGDREVRFQAESEKDSFFPVYANQRFLHLDILRSSVLAFRSGEIGVQIVSSNPTGQWSEPITSE